jgi:hypothetical protein
MQYLILQEATKQMSIMSKLVSTLAKRKAREIEHILNHPIELTEAKLKEILSRHQNTILGRNHGFGEIRTPDEFAERVPLFDFYSMKPYLDRVYENPEGQVMTVDPVIWYVQSSGTSGTPKHLPISRAGNKDYSSGATLMLMSYINAQPGNERIFDGTMVTFAAPAKLGEINGVPLGYMTGISRELLANPLLRRILKPGEDMFNMTNMDEKLWAYAVFSTKTNVTSFGGITTLTIAFLRRMQNEYGPALMDYFKGTKYERRLREAYQDDGTLDLATLWPNTRMIGATGIDSEPYRAWLEKTLPNAVLWDNYAGSEGLYGTTLVPERGSGIQLLPQLNYFEFIPESEVNKEEPETVPLSDVKKRSRYEMVITNLFGWTRYRVGDMLTFVDTDPYSVARIGRRGRVVNLSGEKLSDAHVTSGIAAACATTGAEIIDYTVVGHIKDGLGHYTIAAMFHQDIDAVEFINSFEETVKASNEEFRIVREMGALGATALVRMTQSHSEGIIEHNHIQAKSLPLTSDDSVLASCEST